MLGAPFEVVYPREVSLTRGDREGCRRCEKESRCHRRFKAPRRVGCGGFRECAGLIAALCRCRPNRLLDRAPALCAALCPAAQHRGRGELAGPRFNCHRQKSFASSRFSSNPLPALRCRPAVQGEHSRVHALRLTPRHDAHHPHVPRLDLLALRGSGPLSSLKLRQAQENGTVVQWFVPSPPSAPRTCRSPARPAARQTPTGPRCWAGRRP